MARKNYSKMRRSAEPAPLSSSKVESEDLFKYTASQTRGTCEIRYKKLEIKVSQRAYVREVAQWNPP